ILPTERPPTDGGAGARAPAAVPRAARAAERSRYPARGDAPHPGTASAGATHGRGRRPVARLLRAAGPAAWRRRPVRRARAGRATGLALSAGAAVAGALAYGVYEPNSPLFGRAIGRGPRDGRRCYLTFDDGPNPSVTEPILDTLSAHDVPAAFFLVGEHV